MSSSPQHRAVLVADGDATIRNLLSAIVERMGFEAVVVRDGAAASDLLARRKFAAAVIDLLLPVLGADEIVARLGSENPAMLGKTVVITTLPAPSAAAKCSGVGAILRKPFALDEIQQAIRRCCDC